jgi:sRNA-binding regulator protein Hfq
MITLVVDIFVYRKSVIPGIIYLVTGVVAIGAIGLDLINYYRFYEDMQSLGLLFGVQLADVIQVFDQFVDLEITPMIGLPLTAVGLVLLLIAGASRLVVSLVSRR